MSEGTTTRAAYSDLAALLPIVERAIDSAVSSQDHADVLSVRDGLHRAQFLSKDAEGAHVDQALADSAFDFEGAQQRLTQLRHRLAGTALRASEALHGLLSSEDRRALSRLALGELRFCPVGPAELTQIRRAHVAIRRRREASA